MNKWQKLLVGIQLILLSFFSLATDTIRCNTSLVHVGATTEEVFNQCGLPDDREKWQEIGMPDNIYRGTSQVELWYYSPPTGSQGTYYLYFKDNKLISIEYKSN